MFASNSLFWWAAAIRDHGVVRWPYAAAETAPVDDRDVAAVAARTLYQDGHAGGDAWGATMGRPAFITSAVSEILGSAPRTFREWAADHTAPFTAGSGSASGEA
ncbi:MAG: hypothetical protein ACRDNO_00845 [Trebonia sp.]